MQTFIQWEWVEHAEKSLMWNLNKKLVGDGVSFCLFVSLGYFYDPHKPSTHFPQARAVEWWIHRFCEEMSGEESRAESNGHSTATGIGRVKKIANY